MKRHETRLLVWLLVLFTIALLFMPLHTRRTERVVFRTDSLYLDIGQQAALKYVLETDGAALPQFSSDAPLVVGVDQTGMVTAISPGTAHITLKAGENLSATTEVAVYGIPVSELSLDADTLLLQKGQRTRLTTIMNNGATDKRIFWSSDDESVVKVDVGGVIEAVGGGSARVRATTVNGLTAEARITVEVPLQEVSLSPASLVLGVGAKVDLAVRFEPEDTTERVAAWESTDTNVVRVDDAGRVTAVGIGQARVRMVTTAAQAAYADIVVQQTAESIALLPAEATVARGAEILLGAMILPEKSLSHYVRWESDSPEVATVQDGVVRGLAAGQAKITAIVDGVRSEPCRINVRIVPEMLMLDVRELTLTLEEAVQPIRIKAEIVPNDAEERKVYYSTDSEVIATVDEGGIVTFAGRPGVVHITAQAENGLSATCTITLIDHRTEE